MERTITITESQALIIKQSLNRTKTVLYRTALEHNAEAREMFKSELEDIYELMKVLAKASEQ